jgi:tetratricopeptide (TPR) repeat protein
MTDPRQGEAPAAEALSDVERNARIEQLLVSGLDDYFAGRLEQAVNVWTRVLFLDRSNDRARAYIDRARRAQAERQRETEGLVHEGLQAFDDGDVERARRLLTTAAERGAPHEQTLPVLHRIGLLDFSSSGPATPSTPATSRWRLAGVVDGEAPARLRLAPLLVVVTAIGVAALVLSRTDAGTESGAPVAAFETAPSPLPLPTASEAYLARAETFFHAGKLADALTALDRVGPGDAQYREAQALRGRVQRELLRATAGLSSSGLERLP